VEKRKSHQKISGGKSKFFLKRSSGIWHPGKCCFTKSPVHWQPSCNVYF